MLPRDATRAESPGRGPSNGARVRATCKARLIHNLGKNLLHMRRGAAVSKFEAVVKLVLAYLPLFLCCYLPLALVVALIVLSFMMFSQFSVLLVAATLLGFGSCGKTFSNHTFSSLVVLGDSYSSVNIESYIPLPDGTLPKEVKIYSSNNTHITQWGTMIPHS